MHDTVSVFEAVHIEVGRNATDDFNPFHDARRWSNIRNNPFAGPIVLGFQLGCLIEYVCSTSGHWQPVGDPSCELPFSCYEFRFVRAVEPGEQVEIELKAPVERGSERSGRIRLSAGGQLALAGYRREVSEPRYAPDEVFDNLRGAADRSYLPDGWFMKRKFMMTSNAKNFMCSALVDPAAFIDELAEKVEFPEMFPCALLSNALLERAWQEGHDFEESPLVYRSHQLCIDRRLMTRLKSNTALHLLNKPLSVSEPGRAYAVYGVLDEGEILFRGKLHLAPL